MRRLLQSLTTGYMLMFFSEHLFWARFRPGQDSLPDYVVTWLAYSLLGYLLLALVRRFRMRRLPALFLAGAAFGWLAEGVIVQTAYENFPWQLSWTGLAWHALISVLCGWYYTRQALASGSLTPTLLWSGSFGLFYGAWAVFWWVEEPLSRATPLAFSVYSLVITLLFGLSAWLFQRLSAQPFEPGRYTFPAIAGLFGLLFLIGVLPSYPWAILVLPPLFGLIWWGLGRNRRREAGPDLLQAIAGPPSILNYLALLALPIVAIAFYTLAYSLDWLLATNWVVYLVTTPAGFFAFAASLILVARQGQGQPA
jgi:hypothetical protein